MATRSKLCERIFDCFHSNEMWGQKVVVHVFVIYASTASIANNFIWTVSWRQHDRIEWVNTDFPSYSRPRSNHSNNRSHRLRFYENYRLPTIIKYWLHLKVWAELYKSWKKRVRHWLSFPKNCQRRNRELFENSGASQGLTGTSIQVNYLSGTNLYLIFI